VLLAFEVPFIMYIPIIIKIMSEVIVTFIADIYHFSPDLSSPSFSAPPRFLSALKNFQTYKGRLL
jgi:hypothetical protein